MKQRGATDRDAQCDRKSAVLVPGLISAALLWLAFPPVGIWPLAWVAPAGWLWLARTDTWPVRRPYRWIYVTGAVFWLVYLEGIRRAHWTMYFGWVALALYLAAYVPLFVAMTRLLRRQFRFPLPLAGAVSWTTWELVRAYFATGFSGGLLAHSQTPYPAMIQLAEFGGAYVVSACLMLAAGCVVEAAARMRAPTGPSVRSAVAWACVGALVATVVAGWGHWRLQVLDHPRDEDMSVRPLRVALIQDSVDTIFEFNPQRNLDTYATYRRATLAAVRDQGPFDLIVWPESVFTENTPDFIGRPERLAPLEQNRMAFEDKAVFLVRDVNAQHGQNDANAAEPNGNRGTWMFVGTVTVDVDTAPVKEFNSALLLDPQGQVVLRYYKNHLVMFGEYIPLASWFPWIYRISPMPQGVTPGDGPEAISLHGIRLSPSICFESMMPQLFRQHVARLMEQDQPPDAFVNVTNDGWFWGSSILDTHLQAATFRTVEHRRPLLVAANTGISAWIDAGGRRLGTGARRKPAVIVGSIHPAHGQTCYARWGDLGAGACLIVCIGAVGSAVISRRRLGRSVNVA